MFIVKLLTGVAFLASVAWFCFDPDYEPGIAAITSLAAFVGLWAADRRSRCDASQSQTVGDGGVAVQAGGDANVGNIQAGGRKSVH